MPGSFGLDPYSGSYVQIQYEGELEFSKLFGHLIDFDQESKSLNLFESLKKILQRGNLIGLSENQWVSILLQFSQKYLPGTVLFVVLRALKMQQNCFKIS